MCIYMYLQDTSPPLLLPSLKSLPLIQLLMQEEIIFASARHEHVALKKHDHAKIDDLVCSHVEARALIHIYLKYTLRGWAEQKNGLPSFPQILYTCTQSSL